ncbi:MAG: hypothetical protein Q9184_001812 [Pyrenodesmia sp. 2 TL-2023]
MTLKLTIPIFIGTRLAAIARTGKKSDPTSTAINWISIIGGVILGVVTGWLIYKRTVARARELESEERNGPRQPAPRGRAFSDDADDDAATATLLRDDQIDFPADHDPQSYRDEFTDDEDNVFRFGDGDEEEGIGLDKHEPKGPQLMRCVHHAGPSSVYREGLLSNPQCFYLMPQLNGTAPNPGSLDSAEYNPIDHLNAIFSHPSTLSSIPRTSSALGNYQDELDSEIATLVRHQSASDVESVKNIRAAKDDLAELFRKVEDVRARALQTEEAITEMTADIKRLDNTKRNLTLSMTALKRLQMLTTAYEQLRSLSSSRQYKDCAQLLQAVIQLMTHFKSYRSIDQIATLSRNVSDLQRELLEQICEDFEVTFAKAEVVQRRGMLAEACLVMDALGDNARSRLITWYCNTQLREYRQVFRSNEEAGSLDNISRRFAWFRRMLKTYDDEHAVMFPAHWRMNEMLANAFCEGTREDFRNILSKSVRRADGQSLDVDLLLSCLQETLEFEHSLEKRFSNTSRASVDTFSSDSERAPVFSQAISEAFEPYLSVWVEAQDK